MRLALYDEWGRRCVWGREPLRFSELEVDHLIPKSLSGEPLERMLSDYGLPPTFDLYALPNLVPSCRACNSTKGSKPMAGSPIILSILELARQRASKIEKRTADFERSQAMDEALTMLQMACPNLDELDSIMKKLKKVQREYISAVFFHEPLPPRLKRSKGRLSYDGLSDKKQMFSLIESWVYAERQLALDVVQEGFDGGDTPPTRIAPIRINFLAHAKDMGDYLANVTFNVDYVYITEDYRAEGNIDHELNLWIRLDPSQRKIIDVVVDHLETLEACEGFRTTQQSPRDGE